MKVEEGLKMQAETLEQWKVILKARFYNALEKRVNHENRLRDNYSHNWQSGYDVFRGQQINDIVFKYNAQPSRAEEDLEL